MTSYRLTIDFDGDDEMLPNAMKQPLEDILDALLVNVGRPGVIQHAALRRLDSGHTHHFTHGQPRQPFEFSTHTHHGSTSMYSGPEDPTCSICFPPKRTLRLAEELDVDAVMADKANQHHSTPPQTAQGALLREILAQLTTAVYVINMNTPDQMASVNRQLDQVFEKLGEIQ